MWMWDERATRGAAGSGRNMALVLRRHLDPWQANGPILRIHIEADIGNPLEMG